MSKYSETNNQQASNAMRTVCFTIPWEMHKQISEVVSMEGKKVTRVLLELIEEGLYTHLSNSPGLLKNPIIKLFFDLKKAREHQEMLNALAEIKETRGEKDFIAHCEALGIPPEEVVEKGSYAGNSTRGKISKREQASSFLRVLFTDRPEGLPVNRVLEIAKDEGFGEKVTRQAAEKSLLHDWRTVEGKRTAFWMPLENDNLATW